jgi:predicted ATPase/signal transduction histidine kinase/tRNA A-37 threonylcarbamoyl transferase component Bud32
MTLPLPDYRVIRRLRESSHSRVYEAESRTDGSRVVAKVFDLERPELEDRAIHEFELIKGLDVEGVVEARELRRVGDQLVLVLEHVSGVDLDELAAGQPLELPRFWPIALQVAEILAQTHARKVIHRDIKPTNVLIDDTGRVHLADFGISVLLESERRHLHDDSVLVGTLPYIAPEQTGRTNRAVDFRSDLYSLGATFYQLLTGRLPFESSAPLELIHAHLARLPEPPVRLRPELPEGLSRLVMRLLAKAPESRYQTASGLAADLRQLRALHESGSDTSAFELGREDRVGRLQWPQRLYGRDLERAQLLDAYRATIKDGGRKAVLLVGPTGIGKTALTSVLEAPVVGNGGQLVRGRFDASRELPYSAFVEILTGLIEQLLTESDASLTRARARVRDGLGSLAPVACEFVPALELVIGKQEPAAELGPVEARNRLQIAVERLLDALCEPGRPLVLVFDDLEQADRASLTLLETLLQSGIGPLLIVTVLRRGESDERPVELQSHPGVETLTLTPLPTDALQQLLADMLGRPLADVEPLTATLARKTGGVPLFVARFLDALVERELLVFREHEWSWDPSAVAATQIPDDAVAMMSAKLGLLGPAARELLAHAACLGSRFDLATLALACEQPRAQLAARCHELVEQGLLAELGAEYQFAHDSLRIAAERQLPAEQRRLLHWTIGRHLLANLGDTADELFAVVDHLGAGASAELEADTRIELATLDLRAGRRALDTAAYELAQRYLEHGLELTADACEQVAERGADAPHYPLVFDLQFARAQALALAHEREQANEAFATLLAWPLADHHVGRVVASRLELLFVDGRLTEAIELGIATLRRLGLTIPHAPARPLAVQSLVRAWLRLRKLDREAVLAMPPCSDERAAAIIDIVAQIKYSAFSTTRMLFIYLAGLHARLVARHGLHPTSPVALGDLAMAIGVGLGKAVDALALIERAFELAERLPNPAAARLGVVVPGSVMVLHRHRGFAEIQRMLERAMPSALEHGEFERASFMAAFAVAFELETGTHLHVVHRRTIELGRELERWGSKPLSMHVWTSRCWSLALLGKQAQADDADARDAREVSRDLVRARGGSPTTIGLHLTNIATLHLLFGDRKRVLGDLAWFIEINEVLRNTWVIARAMLVVIVAVEGERLVGEPVERNARSLARKGLRLLERWATLGPTNYGHYRDLALGVRASARGRFEEAVERLERAWSAAHERSCHWIEGLAAEYLAYTLERRTMNLLVAGAWQRAWGAYAAWGATAKLDQLRAARPGLFDEPATFARGPSTLRPRTTPTAERSSTPSLDLAEILRSIGVINEELGLDVVIGRVLDAALTSAGADHGMLVLERDGELAVVATHTGDGGAALLPGLLRLRDAGTRAPTSLINFVVRTQQWLVLDDARADPRFAADPYLFGNDVRSVLALPLAKGSLQLGALVLENRQTTHGFTSAIIETLRLITGQAGSILDNARLYAALRRSEARWRSLVDGAPDVIVLLDEAGKIAFANRRGPFATLDSDHPRHTEAVFRWREAVDFVLEHGQPRELELELAADPTRPLWYAIRIAPIEPDGEGSRRNAVAVATDISARKRAEAEKHTLEVQLRQQQRLESIGTLAAGVAHEINNPIQGILNYAELITLRSRDPAAVEDFAAEISKESDRVATIVRNLLAFSRQDAERQQELIEVQRLIEGTLSLIQTVLRKDHIALVVAPGQPTARVRCRPQQVQQILMNLVTNARDAVNQRHGVAEGDADRKRITIAFEQFERDGRAWVRITIEDNGAGIPDHVLPHIFDPFFTTKGRDQGTGLGLAVSHGLASDNGGELSVETRLGEGTRFFLELPAVEGSYSFAAPLDESASSPSGISG